jgi:hypothetical protein
MVKKYCRLEKTNSLGTCRRNCQDCSWWNTEDDINKALEYKQKLTNYKYYKGRR